ncbi:MAG: glycosyltransferase family 4 protein [Candidatus Scalindua sp.]
MRVLIFIENYLPGYRSGGPVRAISNIVEQLGDDILFKIVTRDRDCNDNVVYSDIIVNSWQQVGKAKVLYLSPQHLSLSKIRTLMLETEYDAVYLNSFFSRYFSIRQQLLSMLHMIPKKPFIIAPRGELSSGALSLNVFRKSIYISLAKIVGLCRHVNWHASSIFEVSDIMKCFGKEVRVKIVADLPTPVHFAEDSLKYREKVVGRLKILFLSRITRMKNLSGALALLNGLNGDVEFNVYGPMRDTNYWKECERIISCLPRNIKVKYCGELSYKLVNSVMRDSDILFLPTLGENYGHVIIESLCSGCPVLISNRTPWRELKKKGVGWDLPLEEPEQFKLVLQQCIDMDTQSYRELSQGAYEYGLKCCQDENLPRKYRELFYSATKGW